jgi:hypothetical protein
MLASVQVLARVGKEKGWRGAEEVQGGESANPKGVEYVWMRGGVRVFEMVGIV